MNPPMNAEVAPARRVDWVERLERLYTAVVSDILDSLGYRQQAMHGRIRPLWPEARCAGYALTVQTAPAREQQPAQPYAGELAAVDALQQHDVLVVSSCPWSVWGELLSTAALRRGCRGVILDGPTRDSRAILRLQFPVFHVGCHPADSRGRIEVIAYNVPVTCGDVLVCPGDLILADHDGVVVIPHTIAEQVLQRAEEKVSGENQVRQALVAGMSATEAFARYGIL